MINPLSPASLTDFAPDPALTDILAEQSAQQQLYVGEEEPDFAEIFAESGTDTPGEAPNFYDNFADLNDAKLNALAISLLEEIANDLDSRSEWEHTVNLVLKYLGWKVEEFNSAAFPDASAAYDSTLSCALIHAYAVARAELLPPDGPADTRIVGTSTPELEDCAERIKLFGNQYVTLRDRGYITDTERLLMYTIFFGCAFRKVYQDPILNEPRCRMISPFDFIANHNCVDLLSSSRITQVKYLTRKEVLLRQRNGEFIEFDLPVEAGGGSEDIESITKKALQVVDGVNTSDGTNKTLFKFYEIHAELAPIDIEPDFNNDNNVQDDSEIALTEIPRPYVITICEDIKKIVSIRRNWHEHDDMFEALQYFVKYSYLPGFGLYSTGLAHLLGANSITLTNMLRQTVDAGFFKNFPAGLRVDGMRTSKTEKRLAPGEWRSVTTPGNLAIQQCFMPMPYSEPSAVIAGLRESLRTETANIAVTAETEIPDMGANAPVGTTLALLEVTKRLQSTVLRSLHTSLSEELRLLYKLFGEYLPEEPYPFNVPGRELAIMKQDFSDQIQLVPVSNPNLMTGAHRLLYNDAILKLAFQAPELHDMHEVFAHVYRSMNVPDIDKILLPLPVPKSFDPVTENMYLISGKKIMVGVGQNHKAHEIAHKPFLDNPIVANNAQLYAELATHIQFHKGMAAFQQLRVQKAQNNMHMLMLERISMGWAPEVAEATLNEEMAQFMSIPPPDLTPEEQEQIMQLPEIQNLIALMDAQEIEAQLQAEQEAAAQQLSPNDVMLAQIEQSREAAHLKADDGRLKAETEAFKAQLQHEAVMNKTEAEREIAAEKHEVDLAIAESKNLM